MRSRILIGIVVLTSLAIGTVASRAGDNAGPRQWSIVNFPEPVLVKDQIVMGPVLIVHDSEKMANGEACTTFYRFTPGKGPQESLVSFHCRPTPRAAVAQTTFTLNDNAVGCKRLTEFQIGGDAEAHGVPAK